MRDRALVERRLPPLHDREAAAEEDVQAEFPDDEGRVREYVPRRDDAADCHGYGPDEVMGSAKGDSDARVSEKDPDSGAPETEPGPPGVGCCVVLTTNLPFASRT